MERLYSVKEIRESTGLTRKQLFEYEKSIVPAKKDYSNSYKYYDKEGMKKLRMAALYRQLGATPKIINSIFSSTKYDESKVLNNLIAEAQQKKNEAERIIKFATVLNLFGVEEFAGLDIPLPPDLSIVFDKDVLGVNRLQLLSIDEIFRIIDAINAFEGIVDLEIESDEASELFDNLKSIFCDLIGENYYPLMYATFKLIEFIKDTKAKDKLDLFFDKRTILFVIEVIKNRTMQEGVIVIFNYLEECNNLYNGGYKSKKVKEVVINICNDLNGLIYLQKPINFIESVKTLIGVGKKLIPEIEPNENNAMRIIELLDFIYCATDYYAEDIYEERI